MGAAAARRQTIKTNDRPSSIPRQLADAALCRFRIAYHRGQHAHFRKLHWSSVFSGRDQHLNRKPPFWRLMF
jgi:hypothetical protein